MRISGPSLKASNLHKIIDGASILRDINIELNPKEIVALIGPSGAGKSTLLQILALLDCQSSGEVLINGVLTNNLSDAQKTKLRRNDIGFVYQFHNLLPEITALENVILPMRIAGKSSAKSKATDMLTYLGLSDRLLHKPHMLSGGEKQRVAIARALVNEPSIIFADEPTGNLDTHTSQIVFDAFVKLIKDKDGCALVATHNMDLAKKMDRIIYIKDGEVS